MGPLNMKCLGSPRCKSGLACARTYTYTQSWCAESRPSHCDTPRAVFRMYTFNESSWKIANTISIASNSRSGKHCCWKNMQTADMLSFTNLRVFNATILYRRNVFLSTQNWTLLNPEALTSSGLKPDWSRSRWWFTSGEVNKHLMAHEMLVYMSHGLWSSAGLKMPIRAHFFGGRFWPVKVGQTGLVLACHRPNLIFFTFWSLRRWICQLVHSCEMHLRCKFGNCRSVTCRDNAMHT